MKLFDNTKSIYYSPAIWIITLFTIILFSIITISIIILWKKDIQG